MEIKDILGLSDPICKLIDVFSNGISALSAPWMHKRMERAKQLMLEEKESKNREIAIKNALAEQLKDNLTGRDLREMKNIADVVGLSADFVKSLPSISEEPVNPDWSARFFDYVKNCSDEEVKNLWARILAGEIQHPGQFSLRTLDILRNISKRDAELIVKYSHRIINDTFASIDMPVMELTKLGDIGIINDISLIRYYNLSKGKPQMICRDNSKILVISDIPSDGQTSFNFKAMTEAGRELSSLIEIHLEDGFLHKLAKELIKNYKGGKLQVSLHEITGIIEDKINYKANPIWVE